MKKTYRLAAFALAVATVTTTMVPVVAQAAAATGKINTANVNLRKTASTKSASLGKLAKGTAVELVAQTGDWYKVKVVSTGKVGYVMKTYVTRDKATSSNTTTTTSSQTAAKYSVTLKQNATIYKTAKASNANKLTTGKKGAKYDVISQTSSFYKIQVSKTQTGYILKKYCTLTKKASTTEQTPQLPPVTRAGDEVGYTSSVISKPTKDVFSTKLEVLNAMSWNFMQLNESFTIKIKDYNYTKLPAKMSDMERYFVEKIEPTSTEPKDLGNGVSELTYKVTYNLAGRVLMDLKGKKALSANDTEAIETKAAVQEILKKVDGKSDYQKIVMLHDEVVKRGKYDQAASDISYTPYGVLVKNKATCQGYAESLQLLYTLAGIENRFVWANAGGSSGATHGFNKVKLDGKWYNVDATVDDPMSSKTELPNRVRHDYVLVTDSVSKQRYTWETKRYPASTTNNNWHKRNKLVATSQKELEALVKAGVKNKQQFVSVWVEDYASSKYNTAFAKKLGATLYNVSTTPPQTPGYTNKPYKTAIFFEFKY